MPLKLILSRVAVRTGLAIWRHRFMWLIGALVIGGTGAYQLASAGPAVVNGDCADTTMVAVTTTNDAAARAAYACLNPGLRSATEDQWVQGMRQRGWPSAQFSRVADSRTNDGGAIVFYTVRRQGESVGYIVYLDPQGRVRGVE
jgi:hypothetical protein